MQRHVAPQTATNRLCGNLSSGSGTFFDGFVCATQGEISRVSFFQKQLAFSNRLTFTIEIYGY